MHSIPSARLCTVLTCNVVGKAERSAEHWKHGSSSYLQAWGRSPNQSRVISSLHQALMPGKAGVKPVIH